MLTRIPEPERAIIMQAVAHYGPIPPQEVLGSYPEQIQAKIIEWADRQIDHRMAMERAPQDRADRAQRNTTIVAVLSLLIAAVVGTYLQQPWLAAVIATLGIGGPNAATIISRYIARLPGARDQPPPQPRRRTNKKK